GCWSRTVTAWCACALRTRTSAMPIPDQAKDGGFFQFPLCWLAQDLPFRVLLDKMIDYGVCHYLDVREIDDESDEPDWPVPWRKHGLKDAYDHARDMIRFTGGSPQTAVRSHAEVAKFESAWEAAGRKTYPVRIRSDIYFSVCNGELSERDFRVLCAVFSAI